MSSGGSADARATPFDQRLCASGNSVGARLPGPPATNVVAGQRPFPIGRGPPACVARDQIRDQTCNQRRLSCPTPSQAKRRIEIRGTYCNGSGHLGRGRRVETQRSHLAHGSRVSECHPPVVGKTGADGGIALSSSSQVRDGGRKAIANRSSPEPLGDRECAWRDTSSGEAYEGNLAGH